MRRTAPASADKIKSRSILFLLNLPNPVDDHFRRDCLGTFEFVFRVFFARTPEKIEVVEIATHIVPAAVTDAGILNAVRRFKLVDGIGEAGNENHRNAAAPCQPAQSAGQSDEHVRVLDEVDSLL